MGKVITIKAAAKLIFFDAVVCQKDTKGNVNRVTKTTQRTCR